MSEPSFAPDTIPCLCATQHGRASIVAKTEVETARFGYETGGDKFGVPCANHFA